MSPCTEQIYNIVIMYVCLTLLNNGFSVSVYNPKMACWMNIVF